MGNVVKDTPKEENKAPAEKKSGPPMFTRSKTNKKDEEPKSSAAPEEKQLPKQSESSFGGFRSNAGAAKPQLKPENKSEPSGGFTRSTTTRKQ